MALIEYYEDLCDLWLDIDEGYGGSPEQERRFREVYVPRLLHRIVDWSRVREDETFLAVAERAESYYRESLRSS